MPQEMHLFEVSFNGEHELVLGGGVPLASRIETKKT